MKLLKAGLLLAVGFAWLVVAPSAKALEASPPPPELDDSPVLITSYRTDNGALSFVQLYNDSSSVVPLDGWSIEFAYAAKDPEPRKTETYQIPLGDYILPEQYAVLSRDGAVGGSDASYGIGADFSLYDVTGLRLVPPGNFLPYVVEEVDGGGFAPGAWYQLSKSSAGNYTSGSEFETAGPDENGGWPPLYGGGLYAYDDTTPLRISEILANPADCAPLQAGANCHEFIEIYNPTDATVDLSRYRLRFGHGNEPSGIGNTVQLGGGLAGGSYYAARARDDGKPLEITASGGSVWLEDAWGLKTYAATVYTYPDIGDGDHKGYSWAQNGADEWRWAVASPENGNNFHVPAGLGSAGGNGLKPCDANQYRSPETNRCRLISSGGSGLTPCDPGEYRSPETNRCRSIKAASSSLKPCKPGQTRNPATNRCRKNATLASRLKPCKPGQERNAETNRCRKKKSSIPETAFAVEPVKETGKAFAGWWALGGVGMLAAGYGAWEWRAEALGAIRKTGAFFAGHK